MILIVTHTQRFASALGMLCRETPSLSMCRMWLHHESEDLQGWVAERLRSPWMTAMGAIDAARTIAQDVPEGNAAFVSEEVEDVLDHLREHGSIAMKLDRRNGWMANPCPDGLLQRSVRAALCDDLAVLHAVQGDEAWLRLSGAVRIAPDERDSTRD